MAPEFIDLALDLPLLILAGSSELASIPISILLRHISKSILLSLKISVSFRNIIRNINSA